MSEPVTITELKERYCVARDAVQYWSRRTTANWDDAPDDAETDRHLQEHWITAQMQWMELEPIIQAIPTAERDDILAAGEQAADAGWERATAELAASDDGGGAR